MLWLQRRPCGDHRTAATATYSFTDVKPEVLGTFCSGAEATNPGTISNYVDVQCLRFAIPPTPSLIRAEVAPFVFIDS